MAHWHIRYSEPICYVNYVRLTHYDWDDGTFDNNLPLASVGSHSWSAAGDYTVQIIIEDHCGATVTGTEVIRIKYPPPVPSIDCNQDVANHVQTPDTVVTFDYDGYLTGEMALDREQAWGKGEGKRKFSFCLPQQPIEGSMHFRGLNI